MVWHVFKKDFRLLWPLSLGIVLLGALTALRTPFGGHFYGSQSLLEQLTIFLPYLANIGIAIVAVIAVQQDALSESQGDWLVRPLRRRDLALAKILFVVLTVNVPLMIVDALLQLALHFPVSVSLGVAASRALLMVFMCSLPGLMLGAVTRSLTNAVVFAITAVIVFVLLLAVATTALGPSLSAGFPVGVWIVFWLASGVIVIGSVASITVQYLTRRTPVARSIGLATVFVALCMFVFLPKTIPLAIQEFLWGSPNSDGIRLSFDPSERGDRSERAPSLGYGIGPPVAAAAASVTAAMQASVGREIEKVRLPLSITGTHPGDILFADRIAIRLVSMAGKVLYKGAGVCAHVPNGTACGQNQLEVRADSADVLNEEELNLPIGLYQRIKDQPVRVEVTYALTRFVPRPTQTIKAVDGLKTLPELGSCATRVDSDGDEIQLSCLTDVGVPSCVTVVLEDPAANRRNPALHRCNPLYGPYRRRGLMDAVNRVGLSVPFIDLSGLAHYPVDGLAIAHARIAMTIYDPVAHFRTSVSVPSVRLADWAPPAANSTAPARN